MHAQLIEAFKHWKIDSRDRLLIAFSGGVDSRVLLELMLELGFKPDLAHCNFMLRTEASEEDEQFCRDLASSRNLVLHVKRFDTKAFAEKHNLSTQMAARELRYQYFEALSEKYDYRAVLTAHHADDQIETVLFKLARGTGLKAIAGINPQRGIFLRPLLNIFKSDILAFAEKKGLSWREDLSNQEDKYLRNSYRLKLIPKWQEIQPNFKEKVLHSSRLLQEQNLSLNSLLDEKLNLNLTRVGVEEQLHYSTLKDRDYWHQLLFRWLDMKGIWDWAAVKKLAEAKKGRYTFNDDWVLSQDNGFLRLSPKQETKSVDDAITADSEYYQGPGFNLLIEKITTEDLNISGSAHDHYLDLAKLKFPLRIRNWKEGDRFQPLGMKGHKKISDYLIDQKTPLHQKAKKMVLESDGKIVALIGERIDHRFRVNNSTKTIYFVRLRFSNITS